MALLVLVYGVIEWRMAATIGPHTVLARNRAAQRAEFQAFIGALDRTISQECWGGRTKWVMLNDADSAMPWLSTMATEGGACNVLRPTIVSPLATLPEPSAGAGACSMVMVEEWSDYQVRSGLVHGQAEPWAGGQGLGPALLHREDWQRAELWNSSAGTYHFALYRQAGCPG